jgi:hypothetical protein
MIRLMILLALSIPAAAYGQSPNPSSAQGQVSAAKPSETDAQTEKPSPAQPSLANVPTPSEQEIGSQENQENANDLFNAFWRWIVVNWTVNHTIATATCIYTLFAILQWCALRKTVDETQSLVKTANRQAKAAEDQVANLEKTLIETKKAADAAKYSAEVARFALHSNRPYLLVMNVTPKTGQKYAASKYPVLGIEEPISSAIINVQNVGGSPAEIIEIVATSWKYECLQDTSEPAWDDKLTLDTPRDITQPVLGVGQTIEPQIRIFVNWTDENIDLVKDGTKRVALYGIIRYRSGPKESYYTRFFYWFSPLIRPELQRASSVELNERT